MHKTKIVCTIGPSSWNSDVLVGLVNEGMNVARINGSHGDLAEHKKIIGRIRNVSDEVGILLDAPGPKIRTNDVLVPVKCDNDSTIIFTTDDNDKRNIHVTFDKLHKYIKPGMIILADDANLMFTVSKVSGKKIYCKVIRGGLLKNKKGLNIPDVTSEISSITEKDKILYDFAQKNEIDFVGLSYIKDGPHVNKIRSFFSGSKVNLISKVETRTALENLDKVIKASDGIMIDRGDLGAEVGVAEIPLLQKKIIGRANFFGKPVITATQMFESMINNPLPTRAETNDVANAILDGTSAVMLSGETAVGKYPLRTVRFMVDVAVKTEKSYSHNNIGTVINSIPDALGKGLNEICKSLPINKIVCLTYGGHTAAIASKYKPKVPIIAVTHNAKSRRQMSLLWGVQSVYYDKKINHTQREKLDIIYQLVKLGYLSMKDLIILTGAVLPYDKRVYNSLEVHNVRDLVNIKKSI